jgi:hypothetical protein
MLCGALRRTNQQEAIGVLVALIDDDEVSGHAIQELRALGPQSSIPYLRAALPKLEAVVARKSSSPFAKKQARRAIERLDSRSLAS